MKLALHEIDEQIAQIERRIEIERVELHDAVASCSESVRTAMTSPKTLLALTGVGFALGNVVFRSKKPARKKQEDAPVKTAGALGLLTGVAGTAISMMGSRGWSAVASWAARRYFDRRRAARAAATAGVVTPPAAAPVPRPVPPVHTR